MIFQHTHELVISGVKTQTRRLWNPNWSLSRAGEIALKHQLTMPAVLCGNRILYYVGQRIAVQPGRGKPAIARIEVLRLWRKDVRDMTHDDAKAEGFASLSDFWRVWTAMHDKPALNEYVGSHHTVWSSFQGAWVPADSDTANYTYLRTRPAERYDALAIAFRLLESRLP